MVDNFDRGSDNNMLIKIMNVLLHELYSALGVQLIQAPSFTSHVRVVTTN